MTIDTMQPSVIPEKGRIVLTGTITNDSEADWRNVRIYPRISYGPFTTSSEVALAAESDPRLPFGDRITSEGHFDASVTRLAPGETNTWKIRIPRSVLASRISGAEGTYQIGVQALGASENGRPENAVGRARTFIPLMGRGHESVPTSVVVPLRGSVTRDAAGQISDSSALAADLEDGRLANLTAMLAASGDAPVSVLLDPALLTAADQLAAGNPPRSLAAPSDEESSEGSSADTNLTLPAQHWLDDIVAATDGNEVLGLPYGDLDVASSATRAPDLYKQARRLTRKTLDKHSIQATPSVIPPSGLLPMESLSLIDDDTTVLMSSEAVPGTLEDDDTADLPSELQVGSHLVQTYDPSLLTVAASEDLNALAVRQRVLAEASVRSLAEDPRALVVNLPSNFDPGPGADDFFTGLDRRFVDLRDLGSNRAGPTLETDHLDYPERQRERELSGTVLDAVKGLISSAATLDEIVSGSDGIADQAAREAMSYASYMLRDDPATAERLATGARGWFRDRLDRVSIKAPEFVILSAANGPFAVTITNGLDVPITLAVTAHTDDELEILAPGEIELEANASRTVQLDAKTHSIGVHSVKLVATDLQGRPIGDAEQMNVRSNSVGKVIWVILGVGVGILFLAIPVRWVRRHRRRKAGQAATDQDGADE